jgi:hypothetical protein
MGGLDFARLICAGIGCDPKFAEMSDLCGLMSIGPGVSPRVEARAVRGPLEHSRPEMYTIGVKHYG